MKNWSIGYEIIRTYVRFAFWLTHKNIVVAGRHHLPEGKPIIFAPNHQNALMDPLAIACTNRHQSVWLARADIFKSKNTRSILKYLKLLPVYRIRDGKENLSNNEDVFAQVVGLLENKQTVALFPEAAHSGKRQMLPHKKAIPRIALEAEEKNGFNLDLQIVPVGIFYSHYWAFNRSLIVLYGEPIGIDKYREEYAENPQKAMLSLRDEIHEKLRHLVIQIDSESQYQDVETIRELAGKTCSNRKKYTKNPKLNRFFAEQDLIDKLAQSEKNSPELFAALVDRVSGYFQELKKAGFTDQQIEHAAETRWPLFPLRLLLALLSLPLFASGFIFNALPFFAIRSSLRRKVKDIAFLSTYNFVAGLVVFPIFYLVLCILIFGMTGSLAFSVLVGLFMPFAGKLAWQLMDFYQRVFIELSLLMGGKVYKNRLKNFVAERTRLIDAILED